MSQEITTKSWGSRIKDAFVGLIVGIILIFASLFGIFWNESSGLHMQQSLEETGRVITSVPASPLDKKNDLKVVYFYGPAKTTETLTDAMLGMSFNAIRLKRNVDMYQWVEHKNSTTEKNVGGSETTTTSYSYTKEWRNTVINSHNFHDLGHGNPDSIPIPSIVQQAKKVTVGDFVLPDFLINKITGETPVNLINVKLDEMQARTNKPVIKEENAIYIGTDPQKPMIGDMRVTVMQVTSPQNVSIIAQQIGDTLQSYNAPSGKSVVLLEHGTVSSQHMLATAEYENNMQMWIIRFITFLGLFFGFALLMKPLVVLADIIPFVGTIVSFGTGLIAFVCGLIVWLIATAIAWFAVRPMISLGLFAIAILLLWATLFRRRKKA